MIGSGIFLKPLPIAQNLPGTVWIYALWAGLGLVCLFGAFAYAELGAMFPEAGGQYAFLREGWGRGVAYLYGWVFFWAINSGTMAGLAVAFANGILTLGGVSAAEQDAHPMYVFGVAAAMILLLAVVNHFGVLLGAIVQNLSTFAKLAALGLIVFGGVFLAGGHQTENHGAAVEIPALSIGGLVAAFTNIFWAYEGWYQLPFNAAELKRPERQLPLGLIVGMMILIVTYVAVNAIYLHVVSFDEMQTMPKKDAEQMVPLLTVTRIFGAGIASYLTLLISISVFGSANPNMLSSPRAFYAMGQDGLVPKALNWVHPRWGTPTVAIWVQAIWALALVWYLQKFSDITDFVVFAGFLFYALTVASVYRLRRSRPELARPYRCTGYPWTPALFILVAVGFVAAMLTTEERRINALYGLAILAAGLPVYVCHGWWTRRHASPS